jgi:DNA-binding transcriptional LysR family regulator
VFALELRQLKTFQNIVELGSFVKAAQFEGYTQSTVTTHIQLLEKELNTSLFDRFGHQLTLTADGEILYEYVVKIIHLAEDAKNALSNSREPHGMLIIGMPESLCVYYLLDLFKEYRSLYPEVELKFKIGVCSDFRGWLRKNIIDLAFFLENDVSDSDLISKFLWSEQIVMVASPEHVLATREHVEACDLTEQTLILVESGSNYRMMLEKNLEKVASRSKNVLEVCQIQAIKEMVISNLGITVLPFHAVKQELKNKKLVALPWQDADFQMNVFLVHHKDKWLSGTIRSFIKLVLDKKPV